MASLEDLIGPLDEISDEELERLVIHGRLAREESNIPKARSTAQKKAKPSTISDDDMAEFD